MSMAFLQALSMSSPASTGATVLLASLAVYVYVQHRKVRANLYFPHHRYRIHYRLMSRLSSLTSRLLAAPPGHY
jgi:hypothetical protein